MSVPGAHDLAIARHRCLAALQRRDGAAFYGFVDWLARHWDVRCPPAPDRRPDADGAGPCPGFSSVRWFEDGGAVFGYDEARSCGCFRVPRHVPIPAGALPPLAQHVVVVEGDGAVRDIVREALAADGYHVTAFASPPTADDLMSIAPDLLILDLGCADGAGFVLLHGLRCHPNGARLPVVACSTAGDLQARVFDDPRLAWAAGLPKPFGLDSLTEVLFGQGSGKRPTP